MPAGTDLIFFDNSADWQVVVNTNRTAQVLPGDRYVPIPAFDLGVRLNSDYIAVVAGTTQGKQSWFFAGDITQVYDFAPGGTNPVLGKIKPERTRLAINRLQLVETTRVSTDSFRLQYQPPYWFRDCTIRVYAYTGDKLNFVEDTLYQIGNALGVDPGTGNTDVDTQFLILQTLLNQKFEDLRQANELYRTDAIEARIDMETQIAQIDAGIYTLAQGLASLLPEEQRQQLQQATQNRLNLDLGFL